MTEYDLMQAAAGKLTALWPDRPVYTGTIPAGADGSFFLESTGSEQTEGLDRFRHRKARFRVRYYLDSGDAGAFAQWAETMFASFRRLEAAEGAHTRTVRLTGRKAQVAEDGKSCQFTFDVDLYYREEPQTTGEVMEYLKQEETWKRQ